MSEVRITRISETRRGRWALFSGEDFLFSIDGETLMRNSLEEGCSLTDGELSLLREASDSRRAKDAALRYLSLRAYGEMELYAKLCLKFDEHSSAAAVAAMAEVGLLDDEAFALAKAKGMAERGKSSTEIRRKLQELRIEDSLVQRALQEAETDDDAVALRLVQKMYMEKLRSGQCQKVLAALARRGFGYAVARGAIEAALAEAGEGGETEIWE